MTARQSRPCHRILVSNGIQRLHPENYINEVERPSDKSKNMTFSKPTGKRSSLDDSRMERREKLKPASSRQKLPALLHLTRYHFPSVLAAVLLTVVYAQEWTWQD